MFKCTCCTEIFPKLHLHVHHRIPKSIGGKDTQDNLCSLCPQCHNALHGIAYKMLNPKYLYSKILDSLDILYKENKQAKKTCLELATYVRDATIKSRESDIDEGQPVQIGTIIRKKHKMMLQVLCKKLRISQEEYVRQVILRDLGAQYNQKIDAAQESTVINRLKSRHN